MNNLSTILTQPIRWMSAAVDPQLREFLQDLQANILKGHGRSHTAHLFLSFGGMPPDDVAALVRAIGAHCTSAYTQLRTNKRYPPHMDGGTVRCFFLSAGGFRALAPHAQVPGGDAFAAGMAARQAVLNDPARSSWDAVGWRDGTPDAMVLIADASPDAVTRDLEDIEAWINGTGARILMIERGLQQHREFRSGKPEGVEHFGYVDGRSQPLFLQEDLDRELESLPGEARPTPPPEWASALEDAPPWQPGFPPSQFLVPDPNGRSALSAGSYFVFRKLEQDVRGFNAAEDALATELFGPGATQDQKDRAGAMVVGRFEDGSPLTWWDKEQKQAVPNGFTFDQDAEGARCPFHAHIRKTNPRGDVQRTFGLGDASGDRNPIMARRGITYGKARPMSDDKSEFADAGQEPVQDSGLLFMAYMASIEAQFEFTQQSWANNPNFVHPATGIDPVIGQTTKAAEQEHVYRDGHTPGAAAKTLRFEQFVHLKGGDYFFAPSLSFLRGVGLWDGPTGAA